MKFSRIRVLFVLFVAQFLFTPINAHAQSLSLPKIVKEPERVVEEWLMSLNKGDFDNAYDLTSNINRIAFYDKSQFLAGYSCISKIDIQKVIEVSRHSNSAEVNTTYEAWDPCNDDWSLKQRFTFRKTRQGDWIITEIDNLSARKK